MDKSPPAAIVIRGVTCTTLPSDSLAPTTWGQAYRGELGSGHPLAVVARHDAVPLAVHALPVGSGSGDLLMAAADEVPPHDELVGERCTAEQQQPAVGRGRQLELVPAAAEVDQGLGSEVLIEGRDGSVEQQQAVLEVRSQRQCRRRAARERELRTEQRTVRGGRRLDAAELAHQDRGP